MTDQFPDVKKMVPITPPPELFAQWEDDILESRDNVDYVLDCAWRNGFQAGADQELEACVNWSIENQHPRWARAVRAARRPEPPSLKEQALTKLGAMERLWEATGNTPSDIVRRALEQLDD